MKILLATPLYPPEIGGPATYSALLSERIPAYGIEVEVVRFAEVRSLPKVVRHVAYFMTVLARGSRADLIYAQDPVSVGFPAILAAKLLRKPFLIRIAGDYAWEQSAQRYGVIDSIDEFQTKRYGVRTELLRRIQRFVAGHADGVITPSRYFRDLVRGWVRRKERVVTIYNGVEFLEVPEAAPEPRTMITAGRLVPWKGFAELIGILQELPEWRLSIAGDGPDRKRLELLIEKLDLRDRVTLLGRVERQELLRRIASSEVFVLNTTFESFSFQVVEAMHAGTPVITTNIGNLAEIVEDGNTGFLIPPHDGEAMRRALGKLEDKALRARMMSQAKESAKRFSIDETLRQTAEMIRTHAHHV